MPEIIQIICACGKTITFFWKGWGKKPIYLTCHTCKRKHYL